MTFEELKNKALSLPFSPGVYIMRNAEDTVIYVGKAKKLKNRVSQYFQDTASHTPKTRQMVSQIHHFDVIVAASEFEALVLECSLIKQHMPKYNILLKDDKGYPYIRLDKKAEYPRLSMVKAKADDGAAYYGPFGSRGVTKDIMDTLNATLKLPACKKVFPRDVGKDRPCLHYHMNQCMGWCQPGRSHAEYRELVDQADQLLSGDYRKAAGRIREQMLSAADNMEFELAAALRDRLNTFEALGKKQLVTRGAFADTDVIGFAANQAKACFTVLHFQQGILLDKDYEILELTEEPEAVVSSLMKQYYVNRSDVPKVILLPFEIEDRDLLAQLLEQQRGNKVKIHVPQRGTNVQLVDLAQKNALEEAQRASSKEERLSGTMRLLGKMLAVENIRRIECFDISNISGTDIVGSMVVFEDGKPKRSGYKRFKIQELENQDDYASMRQVITRRFAHYVSQDPGFEARPDVLLIDGGVQHAKIAVEALRELNLDFPVFGAVKDDRHRTRALVTAEGLEIAIDTQQAVFAFVGTVQEETHRFAITYHRQLRSKRMRHSQLDNIPGVGTKRRELLMKHFRSVTAIRGATVPELERVVPANVAKAVYSYFHDQENV